MSTPATRPGLGAVALAALMQCACGSTVGPSDNQSTAGAGASGTSSASGPASSGSGGACAAFADETG